MPWNKDGSFTYGPGDEAALARMNEVRRKMGLPPLAQGQTVSLNEINEARTSGHNTPTEAEPDTEQPLNSAGQTTDQAEITRKHDITGGMTTAPNFGRADPGAQLDTTLADEDRARTADLLAQLQQQAATGSGSWEGALKAATERSQATAQALGQSTPGAGYASSLTNVGNAQGAAAQKAVGQGNTLREQSKVDAQGQLSALLADQGAQDIEQARAAAGAKQATRGLNEELSKESAAGRLKAVAGVGQTAVSLVASDGGTVPGKAKVFGDDERNDTQHAMLSPGEVVLPRTIAHDPEAARQFVMSLNAGMDPQAAQGESVPHMDEGGFIPVAGAKTRGPIQEIGAPDGKGPGPWKPGMVDTTSAGGDTLNWLGGTRQAPSLDNGALFDTTQADESRAANIANDQRLAARAGGTGPTVAPQMALDANDEAIAQALQAQQQGATAAGVTGGAASMAQRGAGEAALTTGKESSGGQREWAKSMLGQRSRDMGLAGAQQQALFRNSALNTGASLAQQQALQGIFSGVAQGVGAIAGSGAFGSKSGGYPSTDETGDRGGTGDLSGGRGEDGFETDGGGIGEGDAQLAHGGTVGYAGGGAVEGKYPAMPKPKDRSDTRLEFGELEMETAEQRKAREYEEETGEPMPAKKPKKAQAPTMAQRVADFARSLGAGVSNMADGGAVRGYSGESGYPADQVVKPDAGYQGYDPYAVPPRRDDGPVMVDMQGQPLRPAPSQQEQALRSKEHAALKAGELMGRNELESDRKAKLDLTDPGQYSREMERKASERSTLTTLKQRSDPSQEQQPDIPQPPPVAARGVGAGVGLPKLQDRTAIDAEREAAVNEAARLEGEQARGEVEAQKVKTRAVEQFAIEERQLRETAAQDTRAALTRWDAAQEEMNRIDARIDTGRYWADKNMGQKILGIIGIALGSAAPDGINRAAMMMNTAIDRDIEAQKAEYEGRMKKAGAKVASAQTRYGMAREAGMDSIAAMQFSKASALEAAAMRYEQVAMGIKEPLAKAKAQMTVAAMRASSADEKDKGAMMIHDAKFKNAGLNLQERALGTKTGPGAADAAKTVTEIGEREAEIKQSGAKLLGLLDKYGTIEKVEPGIEEQMNQALNGMIIASAKMQDREGVVRKDDEDREKRSIGFEPGFWQRKENARTAIQSYIDNAERRRDNAMRVRGIR